MINEKNDPSLEKLLYYPCQLLEENMVGVAIYSVPDLTLLKANQLYVRFFNPPYDQTENAIGRTLDEIAEGYRGSPVDEELSQIFVTGKSVMLKELQYDDPKRGSTYWDHIVTPITADDRIKYVVATAQDVTERVLARLQLADQEREIRRQKERLDSIVSNLPDPTVVFNKNGTVDLLNKTAGCLFERLNLNAGKIGDVRKAIEFYDADDRLIPPEEVPPLRILKGETLVNFRIRVKLSDEFYYIDINGSPVYGADGSIQCAVVCFKDVTALVNTKELYRVLIKTMQSGIINHGNDGSIIAINHAAEHIVGMGLEDFKRSNAREIRLRTLRENGEAFPLEEHPALVALRTGEPSENTIMGVFNPRINAYRWIIVSTLPIFRPGESKPYQVFTIFNDITEKRKTDTALQKSETLLRAVLDNSNDLTFCYNVQTKAYEFISRACERILGFTQEEMMAMDLETVHALTHPEDIELFGEELDRLLEEKGTAEVQYRHRKKDGEYRWLLNRLYLIRDEDGRALYRSGTIRDVTERKHHTDALRERDMILRMAARGGELGTYAYDFATDKHYISDELKELWGLEPDETVEFGVNKFELRGLHPEDKQELLETVHASYSPDSDGFRESVYRLIRPDGSFKYLLSRAQATFEGTGADRHPVFAAGVVIDVTKRVQAENSIREISGKLRNIIESTDDFIWSVDKDYRLVLFNSSFERYIENKFRKKLRKGLRMRDIMTRQIGALWEDLYKRTAADGKFQVEMKTERDTRVKSYSFNAVYINDELVEITVFGKDITERLNSEREIIRLNASLEKHVSERTEELQKSVMNLQHLSQIISHDLKEPIREIEAYASQIEQNADVPSNALKIIKTCGSMTRMIEDLTKYAMSSQHKLHLETVNIKKELISNYNDLKSGMTNRSILQFDSGLPLVCADMVLLRQVLCNLLSNALKFSGMKELAVITVGCAEEDGQYVFHIRDNGVGFDMKYAKKLFNIFERLHTRDEFEGSGIGLAAVRNIIQRHGGRVWIESEEGEGTSVYFTLPAQNGL